MRFFCILFSICSLLTSCSSAPVLCESKPVVAVFPYWKYSQEQLLNLNWDHFSHLAAFAIFPKDDGSLITDHFEDGLENIINLSHQHGKKVILSVGGAGEASKAFLNISKDPVVLEKFALNVSQFVEKYQLDGIDIDWEYWTYQMEEGKGGNDPVESKQLLDLVIAVKKALPEGVLLTVDTVAGWWIGDQYLPELQDHVDYVNLMAFDFTGAWEQSKVAHHSDFSMVKMAIEYALKRGFKPEKILLGLPSYGKEFIDDDTKETRDVPYTEIINFAKGNIKELASGNIGNIYFETRDNIRNKAVEVNRQNLAGISFFEITSDVSSDELSLLKASSEFISPVGAIKETCPIGKVVDF